MQKIVFTLCVMAIFGYNISEVHAVSFASTTLNGDSHQTRDAVFGDVDGDGDLDLYVATHSGFHPNKLFINDGNGGFTANDIAGDTQAGYSAAMGDLDGDGDLDLYLADSLNTQLNSIFINDGTGSFTEQNIAGDTGFSTGVAFGDVDGDDDLDIYVTNDTQQNKLWINDGNATFTAMDITGDIGSSYAAVMGDVDGDDDLDIYVATFSNGQNKLWINDGSGNFTANDIAGDTGSTRAATMADVDSDGDLDIYNGNNGSTNKLWINDGSGNFTANDIAGDSLNGRDVEAGDVDGDGDVDLVTFNTGSSDSIVWINDGTGSFTTSVTFDDLGSATYIGGVMGDVDGDGDLDIYYGGSSSDNRLLINTAFSATINQASNQDDPTEAETAEFTVVFSEAIATSTFTTDDITLNGSVDATTTSITEVTNATFTVLITGLADGETVTATLAGGVVDNAAGTGSSTVSISTDNQVTRIVVPEVESESTDSEERSRRGGGVSSARNIHTMQAKFEAALGINTEPTIHEIEAAITDLIEQIIVLLTAEIAALL